MSAIPEDGELTPEVVRVLFCLYPGFDLADVTGPMATLSAARHDGRNANIKAFDCITAGPTAGSVDSKDGFSLVAKVDYKTAHHRLADYDVLIIPGGDFETVNRDNAEPSSLIKAYGELQKKNPSRERTLLSVSTGSFILANQGILAGQCATTHPDYYTKFENMLKKMMERDLDERTEMLEERYIVNNPRFDLGPEGEENPYIRQRGQRRPSQSARKGSFSLRESNTRRESNARRMSLKLGGMRVITTGATSTGFDAALYLVSAMVSLESAATVARVMQCDWQKGVVVRGVDV